MDEVFVPFRLGLVEFEAVADQRIATSWCSGLSWKMDCISKRNRHCAPGPGARLHTASEFEGTGIGLAIVKRAVQKMGGTLTIASTVGQGSCFGIRLPGAEAGMRRQDPEGRIPGAGGG